jgi:hypothetical protein
MTWDRIDSAIYNAMKFVEDEGYGAVEAIMIH